MEHEHLRLAVQQDGPVRTEELMGRTYRVFPAVLVREQVLNNNLGKTLLPAAEIQASVEAWNGIPVVIRHPMNRGVPVSARTPEVLNSRGVGFLFRSRWEAPALKADVYLDNGLVEKVEGADVAVQNVDAGTATELSTGFMCQAAKATGKFDGKEYESVLSALQPDHLALLPDEVGACSVSDGCGLGVNHEGDCADSEILALPTDALTTEAQNATDGYWRKLFATLLRRGWRKPEETQEADAVPSGEPAPEPVANETGDQPTEGDAMSKEQMIAHLVANGRKAEALAALSDCDLKAVYEASTKPAPVANRADADPESVAILQERIVELRREKERLEADTATALQAEKREKLQLQEELIYNGNTDYSPEEIRAKPMPELRKLHNSIFKRQAVNYGPRGFGAGPASGQGAVVDWVEPVLPARSAKEA